VTNRKDSNPDTEALELDVAAFVGRRIDEVRSLFAAHADVALIVGYEPIPVGWPEEIVKPDAEADGLLWSYRSASGEWREILVCGVAQRTPTDPIPAFIYTRRPADPSEVAVRPIAQLVFDPDGTCKLASASAAETQMILARKEARRRTQPPPSGSKPTRRLPPDGARSPIEDLERLMGLPRPEVCVDAEDFITESDGRLVLGIAPSPQPVFVVYDAGRNPRLMALVEPNQPPKLIVRTDSGDWPPLEIGPGGLRVLPRCGMESEETALDFYAVGETGHRIIDATGAARSVRILMVAGPCISPTFPNAKLAVRVVALAALEASPLAGGEPGQRDLVVRPDRQFADVREAGGKAIVVLKTTIREEPGAYFLDGVATRG
jgi:hypothetical protein